MGIYFFAYSIVGLYYMLVLYACCEKCSDWLRYGYSVWAEFIYNHSGKEYCYRKNGRKKVMRVGRKNKL